MKIIVEQDNHSKTSIEVDINEMTNWLNIETSDYSTEKELEKAVQNEFDELFNKPEYNNWHKFDRHLDKMAHRQDESLFNVVDRMDLIADYSDEIRREKIDDYDEICQIIRSTLKKKQAELLIDVYIKGITVTEIAERDGVKKSAISHRLNTAKNNFKKIFPNSSTFLVSRGL